MVIALIITAAGALLGCLATASRVDTSRRVRAAGRPLGHLPPMQLPRHFSH